MGRKVGWGGRDLWSHGGQTIPNLVCPLFYPHRKYITHIFICLCIVNIFVSYIKVAKYPIAKQRVKKKKIRGISGLILCGY